MRMVPIAFNSSKIEGESLLKATFTIPLEIF